MSAEVIEFPTERARRPSLLRPGERPIGTCVECHEDPENPGEYIATVRLDAPFGELIHAEFDST